MKVNKYFKEGFLSDKRYIISYGSAGSGKSVFSAQKILTRILTEEGHRILCVRKVASTLKSSVFQLLLDLIYIDNLEELFIINKSDFTITCTLNGNKIICTGLDDVNKLKSIAGITSVLVEEANEITEDDFMQLELRVRGFTSNYKQFILSFNPTDEELWIKKRFIDNDEPEALIIHSTYKNNPFLDAEYIFQLENRMKSNPNMYRIYVEGKFGRIQTGGELVPRFNWKYHVTKLNYDPSLALHLSFDFNALPSCSIGIFQINNKQINVIDEISLEHPHNLTKDVCREFVDRYSKHTSGVFIYGDVAGKSEDTRTERGYNDYSIIMQQLNKFKPQLRIGTKAPSVVMSNNFLNSILAEEEGISLRLSFNDSCKKMIDDLQSIKQNSDGGKLIEFIKHPITNTRYERWGHFYDLIRYFLTQCFSIEYQIYQTGVKPFSNVSMGRRISARNGY